MQVHTAICRYALSVMQPSYPGSQITTPLAYLNKLQCQPVRTTAFVTSAIVSAFLCQSSRTAPKNSFSGPGVFLTDYTNRVHLTACSVTYWCPCRAGSWSKYRMCSFRGKSSCLSIVSFFAMLFEFYCSLSVKASSVASALGLVIFAALHIPAHHKFCR